MPRTPEDLSARDLGQWYKHTWVEVEGFSAPRFVGGINESTRLVAHTSGDIGDKPFPSRPSQIKGVWPKLGSINIKGFAAYGERCAVKSYKRSFCEDCVSWSVPSKWEVARALGKPAYAVHGPTALVGPKLVVLAIWNPTYTPVQEAIAQIFSEKIISAAISRRTILCTSGSADKLKVYYRGERVGYYSQEGAFWQCGAKLSALDLSFVNKELCLC